MSDLEKIKEIIEKSKKITVLSGAGMSTESGVADFRSSNGIWSRYKTVIFQEFISSEEKRRYYWMYKSETIPAMLSAKPNAAHYAVGRLDMQGKLLMLLTQNIDGLHEAGGVDRARIVKLHGSNSEAVCLSCGEIEDIMTVLERIEGWDYDPRCNECGGLLKPNTISFGQNLIKENLIIADSVSRDCDLFMALGSSLQVQPACSFVEVASRNGCPVIIINRDPTPYDSLAHFRLYDSLGKILPELIP